MVTSGAMGRKGGFLPFSSLHLYVYMLLPPPSVSPEAQETGSGSPLGLHTA